MKRFIALMLLLVTVLTTVCLTSCTVDIVAQDVESRPDVSSTILDENKLPPLSKVETTSSCMAEDTADEPSEVITYCYNVTPEEREMLAKLAQLEASICSAECQRAVVSVIFNRLHSGKWRKDMNGDGQITLYDIIYYPNAFTPVLYGKMDNCVPTQRDYDAVDYVLMNGVTVPTQVRYFRTDYDFSWDNYTNYCVIDNVYFGYFTNWKQGAW